MINNFLTHVALISFGTAPLSASHSPIKLTVQTHKPTYSSVKTIEPMAPIAQVTYQPMQQLNLVAFPYSAMNTYPNSYDLGQCTFGAASMKGNIPSDWGNANNWANAARAAGITVSNTPIVGAVAQQDIGYFGHVAVVTAVYPDHIQITEMNYDGTGDGLYRTRDAAYGEFVYIYI